jgi:chaperonin cofactor prefoldin
VNFDFCFQAKLIADIFKFNSKPYKNSGNMENWLTPLQAYDLTSRMSQLDTQLSELRHRLTIASQQLSDKNPIENQLQTPLNFSMQEQQLEEQLKQIKELKTRIEKSPDLTPVLGDIRAQIESLS